MPLSLSTWFDTVIADLTAIEGNHCLPVSYEAVADRSALPAILRFIGSTGSADSLTSEYEKQYSGTLSDGFANWDDLVIHARAHGHEAALQAQRRLP